MATDIGEFLHTPLAGAAACLDRPAVVGRDHDWTWRQVHAASLDLADQMDGTVELCNLCESHLGFLIVWLAAWRLGCHQLLPPSGGYSDLVTTLKSSANPLIVVDDARQVQPHWDEHARILVLSPNAGSTKVSDADLVWSPDWDTPLVRIHTSGSTGAPEPHCKTLGQLVRGALVLGARIEQLLDDNLRTLQQMVCSVRPQHMFGIEASIMLALVHGIPVFDRRPLFPADVRAAFEQCKGNVLWTTTPLHLRALAQSGETLRHCRAIISSTMPLASELAAQVETMTGAPVLEIYGSSETGAVAMRRTAGDVRWRPLQGVTFEPTTQGTLFSGTHFSSPQLLADRIEPDAQGDFRLLGRQADLIKIAGRRASLAGLDLLLQDLPGLVDGAFYLPPSGKPTERLVLIHAGASLDRTAVQAWLRERMDAPFLPRAIICVDRLPRTKNGKLVRASLDDIYTNWLAGRKAR